MCIPRNAEETLSGVYQIVYCKRWIWDRPGVDPRGNKRVKKWLRVGVIANPSPLTEDQHKSPLPACHIRPTRENTLSECLKLLEDSEPLGIAWVS